MGTYLTKGETFATGNTVTAAKLNNLVDNATVTAGSIGSTELANAAVTADKISTVSPEPVTTGTIRDNAVSNAKLAAMGSQTVKVRATNSTGDASDLAMIGGSTNGSSKMLVGTSDSINAVEASQFKLVDSSNADAQDNTAAKLRLHTTAVSDWDTVAAATDVHDDNDRLLIYNADGVSASVASLKQIAPKKLLQSLPALTTTSGVVRLATNERAIDPSTTGTVDADVITVNQSNRMLAKAWISLSYDQVWSTDSGTVTVANSFNIGTPTHDFNSSRGLITFPLTVPLASSVSDYCVIVTGFLANTSPAREIAYGVVTAQSNSSFTVQFKNYTNTNVNPSKANIVIFG